MDSPGVRTRRQAAQEETHEASNSKPNGHVKKPTNPRAASNAVAQATSENIFLFIPNIIGW